MPSTYAYKVRDSAGKVVEGTLEADSANLVVGKLQGMGYTPISVEEEADNRLQMEIKIPGLTNRVRLKDLAVFSRQFATMINSGLTLLKSLSVLEEQTESEELGKVVREVRLDVERGSSLSVALARRPKVFNSLYVAMVKSGETSGTLDQSLERIAHTIEKQVQLRRKVISAMTYPTMVGLFAFLITLAMLIFIVPQFKDMYADLEGTLPAPTRALLAVSEFTQKYWYIWALGGIVGAFGFRRWINSESGRQRWDTIKLRIPVFGPLVRKIALARFSRTLAALTRSGVPILEALDIVAQTAGNWVVATAVRDAQTAVKGGDTLAHKLQDHEVFPPMVIQMISVGEETGALDEMLDKIAEFYENEVETTVDALTSLIEPILIVIMGAIIGGMVIALYLPMFNIINLIE
ncbi:MAG: type II secretion system F family protein [Acidimicrobiia bacterium]